MFCWCHFLWNTSLYFVSQPLCSFKSVSLSSLNSSDYIARASLTVAGSTVPPSAISSINAFPFDSNVAGSVIFYFSAALWSLSDNSSFPLFIFIKWHISLSLGKKQCNYSLCCLYVNWITDAQWAITKTWCDWSLIMMCSCYLHSDLCTKAPAMRFLLYATTHN